MFCIDAFFTECPNIFELFAAIELKCENYLEFNNEHDKSANYENILLLEQNTHLIWAYLSSFVFHF